MQSVLITGARRGLGLELARQYGANGWRVYACCRQPGNAPDLLAVAETYAGVSVHALDVTDEGEREALGRELGGQPIDVLVNNAGIYGEGSQRFGETNEQAWLETFATNCVAPMKMMEQLVENVSASERKCMVNITSKMGSMDDNGSGGSYLYRSSKAALNAVVKSAAIDLAPKGITVVAQHPGWVRTDMGGAYGELSIPEGVAALRGIIDGLSRDDSGRFIDIDGETIAW
ncbi:MAG: SDR family oxidoreductase [bacterium]